MKARAPKGPVGPPALDPGELPEVSPDDLDAYEQLSRIRVELGGAEGKVVLKRRNSKGQLGALGVMAAVDFSIERVIGDWGGGRYVAVFYKGDEKLDTMTFEVDESIPPRVPDQIKEEIKPQLMFQQPQQPREDGRMQTLERSILAMQESIKQQNELIRTVVTAALAGRASGDGNGMGGNALEMGMKIAELIAQRTPVTQPAFADIKDIFLAGLEAKNAAEGGEDGYGGVLKAFAGPIARVLDTAMSNDKRRLMPPPQPAQPGQPAQPAQPAQPTVQGPAWLIHLQPHLNAILSWAKAGKDPELYAEVILDNVEPGAQMEIQAAAQDPEFVSKTLAALPMFVPYSAWATAVLTNIKELLTAPPEEEDEPAAGQVS